MVFIFLVIKPVNIYQALLHIPRRRKDERTNGFAFCPLLQVLVWLLCISTGGDGPLLIPTGFGLQIKALHLVMGIIIK